MCKGKTYEKIYGSDRAKKMKKQKKIQARKRVIENGHLWSIGKNETELLNKQEKIDNCKISRQFNTGIGYIADGYCSETNTIYEIYEKVHDKKIFKDLEREEEICRHLNCDFIIIYDR